jgi:hypothetical protein
MSRSIAGAVLVCLGLYGSVSLRAHHSAVLFDLSKTVTLSGTMTRLDWRNPHIVVFVNVKTDAGGVEAWEFETGAPSWFKGRSVTKSDFEQAVGQPVTLVAVRAKDGSSYGYLYKITFADGISVDLR